MNKQIVRCTKSIGNFKENMHYIAYTDVTERINGEDVKLYQISPESFKKISSPGSPIYEECDTIP